jgi:hypothetical protein
VRPRGNWPGAVDPPRPGSGTEASSGAAPARGPRSWGSGDESVPAGDRRTGRGPAVAAVGPVPVVGPVPAPGADVGGEAVGPVEVDPKSGRTVARRTTAGVLGRTVPIAPTPAGAPSAESEAGRSTSGRARRSTGGALTEPMSVTSGGGGPGDSGGRPVDAGSSGDPADAGPTSADVRSGPGVPAGPGWARPRAESCPPCRPLGSLVMERRMAGGRPCVGLGTARSGARTARSGVRSARSGARSGGSSPPPCGEYRSPGDSVAPLRVGPVGSGSSRGIRGSGRLGRTGPRVEAATVGSADRCANRERGG